MAHQRRGRTGPPAYPYRPAPMAPARGEAATEASAPERPMEVWLSAMAAFLLALISLVVGVLVLLVAWSIVRLGLVGWDRSWLSPAIVFALLGAAGAGVAMGLTAGGQGLLRTSATWRRRLFWLYGLGVLVVVPSVIVVLGNYLGGGAEFLMVAAIAAIVAIVGVLGLVTRAARTWFARQA